MSPSGPNPLSLRHCLPGRTYPTCAHTLSAAAATPIDTPNYPSESRPLRLLTALCLSPGLLASIHNATLLFPQPPTTTLETQQYPLKIELTAKV
jgi:hypothetical protein